MLRFVAKSLLVAKRKLVMMTSIEYFLIGRVICCGSTFVRVEADVAIDYFALQSFRSARLSTGLKKQSRCSARSLSFFVIKKQQVSLSAKCHNDETKRDQQGRYVNSFNTIKSFSESFFSLCGKSSRLVKCSKTTAFSVSDKKASEFYKITA